jgi:hypothetical protein
MRLGRHRGCGALQVTAYGGHAFSVLGGELVVQTHGVGGHQQLQAQRLQTFGQRREAHLEPGSLAHTAWQDPNIETVLIERGQLIRTRPRRVEAISGQRGWWADDAGVYHPATAFHELASSL